MIIDHISSLDETPTATRNQRRQTLLRGAFGAALAAGLLFVGVQSLAERTEETAVTPIEVRALADAEQAAVQGEVAEVFGNKFILADPSGRALIETGRAGEGGDLVRVGETVTVQGRFHHGFLHAEVLTRADGGTVSLHPPHKHGKHGKHAHRPGPAGADEALASR